MAEDRLSKVLDTLCSHSIQEEENGIKHYILKTSVKIKDEANKIQVLTIGQPNDQPIKSVLLLGETGAGKTTIVQAMVNYVFGICFKDDFRLEIVDQKVDSDRKETESQTDFITVYLIYHHEAMMWENSLMLIDTPGLADTRGTDKQKSVMSHLELFLTSDYGIDDLNCIGLVAKANTNRDFTFQKEILGEIMCLLGNNVPDITNLLATFAVEKPMVDQIVRNAGVRFNDMFEFDNGILFVSHRVNENLKEREKAMLAFRWEIMAEQYENFFDTLMKTPSISVTLLREKKLVDKSALILKSHIEELAKLITAMGENRKMLVKYELQEARNKSFRQERRVRRKDRVMIEEGFHAHNCAECDQTCIFPCPPERESNNGGIIGGVAGILGGTAAGAAASQATITATAAARAAVSSGYAAAIGGWVTRALGGAVTAGEVGAVGGVPGIVVGGMVGVTLGAMAGACCGKMLTHSTCVMPGRGNVCGERGCLHSLSLHLKEDERIMESEETQYYIDDYAKELHDVAVSKKTDAMAKIVSGSQKILQCKKQISQYVMELLIHIRNVSALTDGVEVINPLKILERLTAEVRLGKPDHIHHAITVIQILEKAVKKLEFCSVEDICDKDDMILHSLENIP